MYRFVCNSEYASFCEGVIRGSLPPDDNPQQRHVRCGAVSARKWSRWVARARKIVQWVLSARKLSQWLNFSEERAGKPWVIFTEQRAGRPRDNFSEERAGKPWVLFTEQRAGMPWIVFSEQRAGMPRAGFFAERSLPRGAKNHSLRICRPGLRGPGKLSCGQFSPSNGPVGPG